MCNGCSSGQKYEHFRLLTLTLELVVLFTIIILGGHQSEVGHAREGQDLRPDRLVKCFWQQILIMSFQVLLLVCIGDIIRWTKPPPGYILILKIVKYAIKLSIMIMQLYLFLSCTENLLRQC